MKIWFFILFLCTFQIYAQSDFSIEGKETTVIPFKFINNLILIPVNINGTDLTFLLDSGVTETILFSIDNKEINLNNIEKTKFTGLGKDLEIEGLQSASNLIRIGKNFLDEKHSVYVILDESINFSERVGIPVNGIIGYSFFKNHPMKIDFNTEKITIYNHLKTQEKKLKKYESFPISIELRKPYINTFVELSNEQQEAKLLIDLGNSDSIWLFPSLMNSYLENKPHIDDFLGRGFNGDVFGERCRIHRLYLGNYSFDKPIVAVPNESSIQHLTMVKDRLGSIGGEIWRRFNIILDYPNNKIYLKKNKHYDEPFLYNKTGLEVKHSGMIWDRDLVRVESVKNSPTPTIEVIPYQDQFQYKFSLKPQFTIADCRPKSPCDDAGLQKEDQIISIAGKKATDLNLEKIAHLLRDQDDGNHIKIVIKRGNVILEKSITLKDPIPYVDDKN